MFLIYFFISSIKCEYKIRKADHGVCGVKILVLRLDLARNFHREPRFTDINDLKSLGENSRTLLEKDGPCFGDSLMINNEAFCGRYQRGTEGISFHLSNIY